MTILNGTTQITPDGAGYDSTQLSVLNRFLQDQTEGNILFGAIYSLSRGGKTFAHAALGSQTGKPDETRLMQPDTIFPICSTTKFITAAAVMKLVELGELRLTQSVSDFIPAYQHLSDIQVIHLLTHTSGFALDPGTMPELTEENSHWADIARAFDRGETDWLAAAKDAKRWFRPGTQWGYSTFGYTLLGEIIRSVTSTSPEEFIQRTILSPCGMDDTTFRPDPALLPRIFSKTQADEDEVRSLSSPSPWDAVPKTGGGLFSTTTDLVIFGNMMLSGGLDHGRKVLGRKAVEKMTTVYTDPSVKDYCWGNTAGTYRRYGIGPDMRCNEECLYSKSTYFHEGAGKCNLIVDPEEQMVAAYFVPYQNEEGWNPVPIWHTHAIIWGGLM